MPITKGSQAAHERALKAAATRKRNKATDGAPSFPTSYHATPTRHVTRDLTMKQTPPRTKHPFTLPTSKKAVRALSNAELQRQFNYWWHVKGTDMPKRRNADTIVYELREELRRRAQAGYNDLPRIQTHRAARGVRKERGRK